MKEKNFEEQNRSSKHKILDKEEKSSAFDFVKQESLHILHVDDDASFLKTSKKILESDNNFSVDTATSVDEALCKLKKQHYDAIVSDYQMPQKNGLDFLKELREHKNYIGFIIFMDNGTEEIVIEAINLGANYYIDKSGDSETVYCELKNAIINIVNSKKKHM
ncbi:MAG: response regulator [Candidatus Bathyarchaeia archaeon]|jgi:DNA-binding NtrC family response regulator